MTATDPTTYPAATTPAAPQRNGLAVAALVLGICCLVFFLAGIGTLAMTVLAITFGAVSLRRAQAGADHKGMAIAGLSCGITGAVLYLIIGIASHGVFLII